MKKVSAISIVSSALLLLGFFTFLFLAVRPDPDDMIISLDVREHSLYYALKMRYLLSSFRTTLIFSEAVVLGGNGHNIYPLKMFLYFFLTLLAFAYVIYTLIKTVFAFSPKNWKEQVLLLSISVTLTGSVYFLCSNRIEVFGWLGAAGSHLLPMLFVLVAALILLRPDSSFLINALLLAVSSLVIAGGAEHINVIVILANCYLLFLVFARKNFAIEKRKLIFFAMVHFVCWALIFTNPGVWLRVQDVNTAQAYGYDPGNFFAMFFQPYKLLGIALALLGAFGLKEYFQISVSSMPFKILGGIGLLLFCVCFLMGLVAYHSYNIGRIWFPFDLFLLVFFVLLGLRIETGAVVHTFCSVLVVVLITIYSYRHIPALNQFRNGYDDVVQKAINAKSGEVVAGNFPAPDLVNLVDLDANPNNELNVLFCRFYGSRAKISAHATYSKSR